MAEYIERGDVIKIINHEKIIPLIHREILQEKVKLQPAADVVEVKYGKWEKRKTIIFDSVKVGYNCSECNTTWDTGTPYCPNCGAKMDGERKCDNG